MINSNLDLLASIIVGAFFGYDNLRKVMKMIRRYRRIARFNYIYVQEFWSTTKNGQRIIHSHPTFIDPEHIFDVDHFYILRIGSNNPELKIFNKMWLFGKNKIIEPEKLGFICHGTVWELPVPLMKYRVLEKNESCN